ncbi:MAG: hypothetical protein D6814_14325 [Calditrichaeota bacterium]|nr:MAG: hypothetical protein D6814_14325 [Calditrichota bacterium]
MKTTKIASPVVEQDLILVYVDEQPAFYARVEGFEPDRKPNWWQVKLLALQVPLQLVTWILRREQINGEPFTMGGTPVRIEKVRVPEEEPMTEPPAEKEAAPTEPAAPERTPEDAGAGKARILSLGDRSGQK